MARYKKIHCKMYGDEKFRQLSRPQPNAQTLWVYLLTGPETTSIPGLIVSGESAMAESLAWPVPAFRKVLKELTDQTMVITDWSAKVVFVPNAIAYNEPESPNVIKSWRKAFDEVPDSALKQQALARVASFTEGMGKGFQEAFRKAFDKPYRKAIGSPPLISSSSSSSIPPNPHGGNGGAEVGGISASDPVGTSGDDEIDQAIRKFFDAAAWTVWNHKRHASMRQCVAALGWNGAIELIDKIRADASVRDAFPVAVSRLPSMTAPNGKKKNPAEYVPVKGWKGG